MDSVYPIGSPTSASKFFDIYLKQREWLEDEHMDAALSLYRLRFQQHPSMFQSTEIAIMAVAFQILWAHQYENWKSTSFLPEQSLGSHGYFHPDRTVKIYDSGKPKPGDVQLREVAEPFARMVPYELWFYKEEERKPSVDRTDFSIESGMYVESARANANMWDPEFVTKMIDAAVPVKITGRPETKRNNDNVFTIYPEIDGKGTANSGHFKADDSPAG
ncbi:hypothetical protein DY000_02022226 [Brassica cretica]|uniref:Uncharacterized protein n=1 Tax=Brassica cretica TaxID=69181 RepID=A0ABQ7DZ26_BRACR|nr:hypothetical protein DY000_02022226 [Brassica cretica]